MNVAANRTTSFEFFSKIKSISVRGRYRQLMLQVNDRVLQMIAYKLESRLNTTCDASSFLPYNISLLSACKIQFPMLTLQASKFLLPNCYYPVRFFCR